MSTYMSPVFEKISVLCQGSAHPFAAMSNVLPIVILIVLDMPPALAA